jgi:hypothetical protein
VTLGYTFPGVDPAAVDRLARLKAEKLNRSAEEAEEEPEEPKMSIAPVESIGLITIDFN